MKAGKGVGWVFVLWFGLFGLLSYPAWLRAVEVDSHVSEKARGSRSGNPKIVVNVAARQLRLFDENEQFVAQYAIAVGSPQYKTPLGKRELIQIVWNPWWYPPKSEWAKNAKITPPGKGNPLGPVKMKLDDAVMFHGTNAPKSVGKSSSHGCMRMYNDEATQLARWLQSKGVDDGDLGLFEKVEKYRTRSFSVRLQRPIPIEIVYQVVEIKNGKLHVYNDVYRKIPNILSEIERELEKKGYKGEDIDWEIMKKKLKTGKNKKDIEFSFEEIGIKNKAKNEMVAKAMNE